MLQVRHEQATNIMISAVVFAVVIAWFLAYLFSYRNPQIEYYELMLIPETGTQYYGLPSFTPGTLHVVDFLHQIEKIAKDKGKDFKLIAITIPDSFKQVIEWIKKRLKIKDDDALVMFLNNRIVASEELMQELGDMHKEMKIIRKSAEARVKHDLSRRITSIQRKNTISLLASVLASLLIGFLIGMGIGANWMINIEQPGLNQTEIIAVTETMPSNSGIPYENTTITPAQPPPPPISEIETVTETPVENNTVVGG